MEISDITKKLLLAVGIMLVLGVGSAILLGGNWFTVTLGVIAILSLIAAAVSFSMDLLKAKEDGVIY